MIGLEVGEGEGSRVTTTIIATHQPRHHHITKTRGGQTVRLRLRDHISRMRLDLRIPAPKSLWESPLQPPGIPTRFLL
jgi:hypothetical protein